MMRRDAAMSVGGVDAVRELVAALRINPYDADRAELLADWCEEKGFDDAALRLRGDRRLLGYMQALSAIQNLFGYGGSSGIAPRYDAVVAFPVFSIPPGGTDAAFRGLRGRGETAVFRCLRIRKLVLPARLAGVLFVTSIRLGARLLLDGTEQVDAEVFAPTMPDTFDHPVVPQESLTLEVENTSNEPLTFSASFLAMAHDPNAGPEWLIR